MKEQPIVNVAIQAVRKAADLMLRYRNQLDRVPVTEKARHDYVTEVDRTCERAIIDTIKRNYPGHAILAEESGQSGTNDVEWVIDPLDGTSNYLRDIPHYAISIGVRERGQVNHAVVYDPLREELFTASRGRGAMLNNRRLRVSPRKELAGAILGTAFPFRKRQHMGPYRVMLKALMEDCEDIRRAGAASLDLAYVAAGRLDGYFEIGLSPWDIAAGSLLVTEAGGVVQDFSGGEDWMDSGNIVAAPYKLVTPLQQVIGANWKGA